ncbi:MAG TPA: AraC family transcriptional regulator [Bacillota bacterium]
MDWLERMNRALDYLEQNIEAPLDIQEVSRVACASPFHFQRMFHILTGVTVAEYVRKRKLTLAAQELAASNIRVLDVSLKYGYDSPESFAKAFRKVHGLNPSEARGRGMGLKAYPRISFHISVKGAEEMDYKIIEKQAFRVLGKGIRVTTRDGENLRRIPKFWDEFCEDGSYDKICKLMDGKDLLGICMEFSPEQEELTYMIAAESGRGTADLPEGWMVKEIPAETWAVFPSVGTLPDAIQKVWERIFSEWFPATGYEHADGPELEVYPQEGMNDPDYRCEVWIPITKK